MRSARDCESRGWGRRPVRSRRHSGSRSFLFDLALGACAAYFLDPDRGRQRRALVRDRSSRLWRRANEVVEVTRRDVEQRAQGIAARARGLLEQQHPVPDGVLVERIRAAMGRCVSHAHAIRVTAEDGWVTLEGPILSREVQGFVRRVRRFPGVRGVGNRLEVHTPAEDVPELRVGVAMQQRRNLMNECWPPAARLLAGSAGAFAWLLGAPMRGFGRYVLGTLGGMLVWRAVANVPANHRAERAVVDGELADSQAQTADIGDQR